jgi:hypothetical protein
MTPSRKELLQRCRKALRRLEAQNSPSSVLIARLDEMAERLRAAPGWRPPTPGEAAASARVEAFFREWGKR